MKCYNLILEIKKYEYDIKDVGIKISKVYLSICIDNKNFNSRIY